MEQGPPNPGDWPWRQLPPERAGERAPDPLHGQQAVRRRMDLNPDFEAAWRRLEDETAGRPAAGLVRLRLTAERDDGLYLALDAGTRRRTLLVAVDDPD